MSETVRIRVGRKVLYSESATVRRAAFITAFSGSGAATLLTLTVLTDANANGVVRVQNVPLSAVSFDAGADAV